MSEKKVVSRNIAIALGIVCIVFLVGLIGAITNYTSIIDNKDSTIQSKDSEIQTLTNQKNQLQTWLQGNLSQIDSLNSQISSLNAQIASLQNQIDTLEAPKLKGINLTAHDNRPLFQPTYLHVYGYVCNVGTGTAYDAILYVEAFQGSVLAFNTTISLGTINGENYTYVDSKIYYPGAFLTEWHVWSQPVGIDMNWAT